MESGNTLALKADAFHSPSFIILPSSLFENAIMLMSRTTRVGIFLLLTMLLYGCGRKGPLFMQPVPAKPVPVAQPQAEQTPPTENQTESKK